MSSPDVSSRPAVVKDVGTSKSAVDLQYAATYGAAALSFFALVKVYASAYFSLTTAAALLTTAPLSVFLGATTSYSYEVFPLVALALVLWILREWIEGRWRALTAVALTGAALAALVSPPLYLLRETATVSAIGAALYIAAIPLAIRDGERTASASFVFRRKNRPPDFPGFWRSLFADAKLAATTARPIWADTTLLAATFSVATLLVILESLTNLWLPIELIVYQQGAKCEVVIGEKVAGSKTLTTAKANNCKEVTGAVLDDKGTWTSVVAAGDRGLRRINTESIRYRELCHLSKVQPNGARPLLWVLARHDYISRNTSCQVLIENVSGATLDRGSLPQG